MPTTNATSGRTVGTHPRLRFSPTKRRERDKRLTSIGKAVALLAAFTQEHPTLTVSEGARIVGTDKGTVSRILARLAIAGLLERAADGRSYHVGVGLLTLGQLYLVAHPIAKLLAPRLASLARRTGCVVQLVIRDGPQCVVIASASGPDASVPPVDMETRLPMHATAAGKAFMAWLTDDELQRLLQERQLISYTGRTLSSLTALREALRSTRERGFATAEEEYFLGQHSVAVPIVDTIGKMRAALVAVSERRLDTARRDVDILARLQNTAASVAQLLARSTVAHPGAARGRRSRV